MRIEVSGRLAIDPTVSTAGDGRPLAIAVVNAMVPRAQGDDGSGAVLVQFFVLAHGDVADALAKHGEGDMVSVAGELQVSLDITKAETIRKSWQCVADSVAACA